MEGYVLIKIETLTRFADNARLLGSVETELSTEQMLQIFSDAANSSNNEANVYYIGKAESVLETESFDFESSAVGVLT